MGIPIMRSKAESGMNQDQLITMIDIGQAIAYSDQPDNKSQKADSAQDKKYWFAFHLIWDGTFSLFPDDMIGKKLHF